jgi:microcystin-dependent protein
MEEVPMTIRGEAMRRRPSRSPSALPQQGAAAAAPPRDRAARLAGRRALGLGALAALFALISRSSARASDALTIESDGATIAAKRINFGKRLGALLTLYDPGYVIGIQPNTFYQRSDKNFGWYKGGGHADTELDPGGGSKMMALTDGNLDVSGNVAAASVTGKGALPVGAILMWSGDPAKLPAGWVLCDGGNKTPDLRGRFIVGYHPGDLDYNQINNSGGEAKHLLRPNEISHSHALGEGINYIADHTHRWAGSETTGVQQGLGTLYAGRTSAYTGDILSSRMNAAPHENRPPYYVLAYIMFAG